MTQTANKVNGMKLLMKIKATTVTNEMKMISTIKKTKKMALDRDIEYIGIQRLGFTTVVDTLFGGILI